MPTFRATLGVQGHRPVVGTWEHKDQGSGGAARNVGTGQLTTRLPAQPSRSTAQTDQSQQQRWPGAFAAYQRDMARASPARASREVVLSIDHAPWHRGARREQG